MKAFKCTALAYLPPVTRESPPAEQVASGGPPEGACIGTATSLALTDPLSRSRASQNRADQARKLSDPAACSGGVSASPARSRSAGQSEGPRDRAPFLLVHFLWANKENEQSIILPGSVEPLRVLP